MSGYEFYIGSLRFVLHFEQVFIAAVLAFFITYAVLMLINVRRLAKDVSVILSGEVQMKKVMEKCHRLFPIEMVEYHGTTFKRGMVVKITLSDHKSFTGCFVGLNQQGMICVVTPRSVIARELGLIEDLVSADDPSVEG